MRLTIIISILSSVFNTSLFSQDNVGLPPLFQITSNGNVADIQPYKEAITKADWNCYRTMNKSRMLYFDSGVVVELFSVKELHIKGYKVVTNCLADEKNLSSYHPVYHLSESGIIIEMHTNQDYKNYQKEQGEKK